MRVAEVMTQPPDFCTADDLLADCARQMAVAAVSLLPVCESRDTRRLVGCVSDRDILESVITGRRHPAEVAVGEVMSQHLVTCSEIDDLADVFRRMTQHKVHHVLVVDEYGSLVGVVRADEALVEAPPPSPGK